MVDTSSPGFSIEVVLMTPFPALGGQIDTLTGGQKVQILDVTESVLSLEWEDSEQEMDRLKLKVENHDLRFWDSPAFFKGNLIRFMFGYPGRLLGPRYVMIDELKGFQTLDVSAIELTMAANEVKPRRWADKTRTEIVLALVSDKAIPGVANFDIAGVRFSESQVTVDSATIQKSDNISVLQALKEEKPKDWTQNLTDWQFIQMLASEVGCESYVEGDVLHFHPRRLFRAPSRHYEYFYGQGDLLDFSVTSYMTIPRPGEFIVKSYDPVTRTTTTATGSDSETKRNTLGPNSTANVEVPGVKKVSFGASSSGKLSASYTTTSPRSDPATVRAQAHTMFMGSEVDDVRASATIIGDPYVGAKSVIEIAGISQLLSGKYFIVKVVHKIDSSGYRSVLELFKNAIGVVPSVDPPSNDPTKAKENKEKVGSKSVYVKDAKTNKLRLETQK